MKFDTKSAGKRAVKNYMGGKSFSQSAEEELVFSVLTSFIEDSYYESRDDRIKRISSLVKKIAEADPIFVAKLAIITRKEFHMRSAFHVLVSELAKYNKGNSIVKNTIKEGVERVDDLLEIISYSGKPIPNQIKKGVALALNKFNSYQLAKYKGEGKEYSLVDVFNMVHPKPSKENKTAFNKLINGELKLTGTWESKLTKVGQEAENETEKADMKSEVWKDLVLNEKIGYMALLRNLRNILKQSDERTLKKACKMIADRELVKKSKQLPFRFLSAYEAISGKEDGLIFEEEVGSSKMIKEAIKKALSYSVENIPLLNGKTVILTDNSGSMRGDSGGGSPVSAMSHRKTSDIANLFAVLYWLRANNTLVGVFGDTLITPKLDREKDIFENYKTIDYAGRIVGGGTEAGIFTMFEKLIEDKIFVDRVVIFSDSQVGNECQWYDTKGRQGNDFNKLFQTYKSTINPKVNVYNVDLRGYGNSLFSDGVFALAGWSDKIFELMQIIEKKEGLVKWIESYPVDL